MKQAGKTHLSAVITSFVGFLDDVKPLWPYWTHKYQFSDKEKQQAKV